MDEIAVPRMVFGKPLMDPDGPVLADYRLTAISTGFPSELEGYWRFFSEEEKDARRIEAPIGKDGLEKWTEYPWRARGTGGLVCLPVFVEKAPSGAGYMLIARVRGRFDDGEFATGGRIGPCATIAAVPLQDWRPWMLSAVVRSSDLLPNPTSFGSEDWSKAQVLEPALLKRSKDAGNLRPETPQEVATVWQMIEAVVTDRCHFSKDVRTASIQEHFDLAALALSGVPLQLAQQIGVGAGLFRVPVCASPFGIGLASGVEAPTMRPAIVGGAKLGKETEHDGMVRYVEMLRRKVGEAPSVDELAAAAKTFSRALQDPVNVSTKESLNRKIALHRLKDDIVDQILFDRVCKALKDRTALPDVSRASFRHADFVEAIVLTLDDDAAQFNYDGFEQLLSDRWAEAWAEASTRNERVERYAHFFGMRGSPRLELAYPLATLPVTGPSAIAVEEVFSTMLERDIDSILSKRQWDRQIEERATAWNDIVASARQSAHDDAVVLRWATASQTELSWLLAAAKLQKESLDVGGDGATQFVPLDLMFTRNNAGLLTRGSLERIIGSARATAKRLNTDWVLEKWLARTHKASRLSVSRAVDCLEGMAPKLRQQYQEVLQARPLTAVRRVSLEPQQSEPKTDAKADDATLHLVRHARRVATEVVAHNVVLDRSDETAVKAVVFGWHGLSDSERSALVPALVKIIGTSYAEILLDANPSPPLVRGSEFGMKLYMASAAAGAFDQSAAWRAWRRWSEAGTADAAARDLVKTTLLKSLRGSVTATKHWPNALQFSYALLRGERLPVGMEAEPREDRVVLRDFLADVPQEQWLQAFATIKTADLILLVLELKPASLQAPDISPEALTSIFSDDKIRLRVKELTPRWSDAPIWRLVHLTTPPRKLDKRELDWLDRRSLQLLVKLGARGFPVGGLLQNCDLESFSAQLDLLTAEELLTLVSVVQRSDEVTLRCILDHCLDQVDADGARIVVDQVASGRWWVGLLGKLGFKPGGAAKGAAAAPAEVRAAIACGKKLEQRHSGLVRSIVLDRHPILKSKTDADRDRDGQRKTSENSLT